MDVKRGVVHNSESYGRKFKNGNVSSSYQCNRERYVNRVIWLFYEVLLLPENTHFGGKIR